MNMIPEKYKINPIDDLDIAPEETFADVQSAHAVVELPMGKNVLRLLYFSICVILIILFVQAFNLQIVNGDQYALLADQSKYFSYSVPALRGGIFDRNGKPIVENIPVFDLVAVRNELSDKELADAHKDEGVFVVKRDISKDEAIRLQAESPPGLYVATYAKRNYIYGQAFAHVIGYTSQVSQEELNINPQYHLNEKIGRLGLEAFYDDSLRGNPYAVFLNPETIRAQSPVAGDNLYTNLDIDVQMKLYESLRDVFHSSGIAKGSAIVQNVKTGEVLGLVSMPTFDSNTLDEKIFLDRKKPLFNRVIGGSYSPGSSIKPFLALVGLKEKVVDTSTVIFANGAIEVRSEVDSSKFYVYRDWKVHGWTDIYKAIADSVDIYFYALAGGYGDIRGLGIDKIEKYLKNAGANKKTGIDLPGEVSGFVPSKEWKRREKDDSWYVGDTYNVSIGQGDLSVTPLWLNTYISAIANGGNLMKPLIAKGDSQVIGTLPFDSQTLEIVRRGMRQTITDGTGQMLKDLPKNVAAKTGTAQVGNSSLNSLFVVFGPYEDPEISMTVLVEDIPQSQSLAMQVAKNFLTWYFSQ